MYFICALESMIRQSTLKSVVILSLCAGLAACSTTRHLPSDQYLLVDNRIVFEDHGSVPEDDRNLEGDLEDLARQQPNEKMLGLFRLRLFIYNLTRDTTKRLRQWLNRKAGDPPVIFDSARAEESVEAMRQYLFYKGYFSGTVWYGLKLKGKKAVCTYHITRNELTYIDTVVYEISDPAISDLIHYSGPESPLQAGKPYDVDFLLDERSRIHNLLRDHGYFDFKKQYVYFELDTLEKPGKLDLYVKISPPEGDSTHRVYRIDSILIYTDYWPGDSSAHGLIPVEGEYYFMDRKLPYNPKPIVNAILFEKGNKFSYTKYRQSVQRLSELGLYRFVNISFEGIRTDSSGDRWMIMVVRLTPGKRQSVTTEIEANTSSDYFLGSRLSFSYGNKNLFRQADLFRANLNTGIETLLDSGRVNLNTVDLNAEAAFVFPMFLEPFNIRVNKLYNPKTQITVRYNYFKRLNLFNMNSLTLTYGYTWKEFEPKTHTLNPVELNLTRLGQVTDKFNQILADNPLLRKSFEEQLIIGSGYTFVFNRPDKRNKRLSWYFRGNLNVAGNLLRAGYRIANPNSKDSIFYLFQRPFSQYIRPDAELRLYTSTGKESALVLRAFAGAGITYGNSQVMPYVKQYISGGSNSLRAFRIRTLGPGSYRADVNGNGSVFPDQSGDIKLEMNAEYRFNLTGMFNGAFFADAGNIWLLREDTAKPGANFAFDRFYKEIAIGAGAGLRMDFSFFVFRIDLGIPLYDPSLPEGDRWKFKTMNPLNANWRRNNLVLNLAIGYPF